MNMQERKQKYKGKFTFYQELKNTWVIVLISSIVLCGRRCMKYFDNNTGVIQWSSEEIAILYYDTLTKGCVDILQTF